MCSSGIPDSIFVSRCCKVTVKIYFHESMPDNMRVRIALEHEQDLAGKRYAFILHFYVMLSDEKEPKYHGIPWRPLVESRRDFMWLRNYVMNDVPASKAWLEFHLKCSHTTKSSHEKTTTTVVTHESSKRIPCGVSGPTSSRDTCELGCGGPSLRIGRRP